MMFHLYAPYPVVTWWSAERILMIAVGVMIGSAIGYLVYNYLATRHQ